VIEDPMTISKKERENLLTIGGEGDKEREI
jgi:hypothetical protein